MDNFWQSKDVGAVAAEDASYICLLFFNTGKSAYSGSVLSVPWLCHDFSDLAQGALKLDLFVLLNHDLRDL